MRVAVTDFVARYTVPSQGRSGIFTPQTSLRNFEEVAEAYGDPLLDAVRLLEDIQFDRERLNIICGASKGDLNQLPNWAETEELSWTADAFASQLARALKSSGPVLAPNAACATSTHALALAAQSIHFGTTETALAGGIEYPQPELILAAYRNMHALSKSGLMRPFDARRDGFVAGAGYGFLLLESEMTARGRGAKIHGYITGWSLKCDASHITSLHPSGDTIVRAIGDALNKAGNPRIDYINAHGTATKLNDEIESRAIETVFGRNIPISSTKPLTGHLLGAAGAVEASICLKAMEEEYVPPTLNLEEKDAYCPLDYVPNIGRTTEVSTVLSLNYGFGGHIGALVFEKG